MPTTNTEDQPISTNPLLLEAKASKVLKPKEKQVWIDTDLYCKVEMLNIKHGKPVPTKHFLNVIIKESLYNFANLKQNDDYVSQNDTPTSLSLRQKR